MDTEVLTPWDNPRVADVIDQFLARDSDMDTVLSMIPGLFGISDKATYLAYRALGFNPAQSLQIMELDEDYLDLWYNETPELRNFELRYLRELQTEVSTEIIRLGFLKNMAMFIAKDAAIIRKSLLDFEYLSKREWEYLMKTRGHYTPSDLLNLDKAINPDAHQENVVINLSWGPHQAIEGVKTEYQLVEGVDHGNDGEGSGVRLQGTQEQGAG